MANRLIGFHQVKLLGLSLMRDYVGLSILITFIICKKVSSAIAGLRQIRDFVPSNLTITVYNGLIQPWFDNCDIVWDNLPITLTERLQKLQNREARNTTRMGYDVQ